MKNFLHYLEYLLIYGLLSFFKCFPAPISSAIGGSIGRTIGPMMGLTRRADRHLCKAMPELTKSERKLIIKDMWDHFGRIFSEYPHLENLAKNYTEIVGADFLKSIKGPSIAISGHIGNWELIPTALFLKLSFKINPMYRAPNNPYVDKLLNHVRTSSGSLKSFKKSRVVIRSVVQALSEGESIGILIDQKFNEGIDAPFFGLPAKTSTAFVSLQAKYGCPLFSLRCERLKGCSFKITIAPFDAGISESETIKKAHVLLENWIKERPSQWLWPHRRWHKDALLAQPQTVN